MNKIDFFFFFKFTNISSNRIMDFFSKDELNFINIHVGLVIKDKKNLKNV